MGADNGEKLPLSGVRVIEFSHMVMGPTCGMILADLGADVIKIEPPAGDNTRRLNGSGAGFFPMFNRNKRSIAVDVKDPRGLALVRSLLQGADVMIENFRPGALAKLGLGPEDVAKLNPGLVYYSAKGFLPGPYDTRTALDEVVQMMAGLAYMTGPPGRPLRAGSSVNDIMGGMFGVIGILAALRQRDAARGAGDAAALGGHVTSALFETCIFLVGQHMMQYAVTGKAARPMPERLSAWAVYDVFDCADGQLFLGVVSNTQWKLFCEDFGLLDMLEDPTLQTNPDRCLKRDEFIPRLRALFAGMPVAELTARVARLGLPFSPINRPEDLVHDPHLIGAGGLIDVSIPGGGTAGAPAIPLTHGDWRPGLRHDVPELGAHGRAVAAEAGFDAADIDALVAAGVLVTGEG
jgi:crotonobetainyl-CoA:carnitine CoA-transferase CaiB-like acyl-CoA transferase